jgi:hypothetical protein
MSNRTTSAKAERPPLTYRGPAEGDLEYFTRQWWSGARGDGSVPADLSWTSNPKQHQEEEGAGVVSR